MVGATKILTVSYGTFSCTLEGFDDAFGTMKAIAEYFRDLAAEDRYFGAVPPTPDAEMLQRIAEREIRRRVEARLEGGGVHLRAEAPAPAALGSPAGGAVPAASAAGSEPVPVPAAAAPAPAATPAPEPAPVAARAAPVQPAAPAPAAAEDSVAAKLARIRAIVARSRGETAAPAAAAFAPVGPVPAAAAETYDDEAEADAPPAAAAPGAKSVPPAALSGAGPAADAAASGDAPAGDAEAQPVAADESAAFALPDAADGTDADAGPASPAAEGSAGGPGGGDAPAAAEPPPADVPLAADLQTGRDRMPELPEAERAGTAAPEPGPAEVDGELPAALVAASRVAAESAVADPVGPSRAAPEERAEPNLFAGSGALVAAGSGAPPAADAADAGTEAATTDAADAGRRERRRKARVLLVRRADYERDPQGAIAAALAARAGTPPAAAPAPDADAGPAAKVVTTPLAHDPVATVPVAGSGAAGPAEAEHGDRPAGGAGAPAEPAGEMPDAGHAAAAQGARDHADTAAMLDEGRLSTLVLGPEAAPDDSGDAAAAQGDRARPRAETAEAGPEGREAGEPTVAETAEAAEAAEDPGRPDTRADAADLVEDLRAVVGGTSLSPEAEDELIGELAEVEREAMAERRREGRAALDEAGDPRREAAVARLVETANARLEGSEQKRRRSAIQHLKAAVAATVADRKLSFGRSQPDPASELDRYRDDLNRVVQPRRTVPQGPARRPAAPAPRLAPLVLVSELRIDRPAEAPVREVPAVRPRRVTPGAVAAEAYDDAEDDVAAVQPETPASAASFAEFAEARGAHDLPDLLEAAAAYMAIHEGRAHFSRPQLMSKVAAVARADLFTREAGLRSFGTLIRQGRIQKARRGQFTISKTSRFTEPEGSAPG